MLQINVARVMVLCTAILVTALMTPVLGHTAPTAPGRIMAQQATKGRTTWNTTDHSKHAALNKDFKSGKEVTQACLSCHSEAQEQFHKTIHWTWLASEEKKSQGHGKAGLSLNNFCISTNKMADTSCLGCHPGWGESTQEGINCLVCHSRQTLNFDETVEDIKGFLAEKDDAESLEIAKELQAELRQAAQDIGRPGRNNCGGCHFLGGGGDGVKHGDLDTSLTKPASTLDVHMGADGQNFDCVRCHTTTLHNISGRIYTQPAATSRKSLVEDDLTSKITCESCHTATPHESGHKANDHTDKVACQTCHIPAFARVNPTKMSWDWSKAGKTKDGKKYKQKGAYGKYDYLSIKGEMKWEKNIAPEYFWFNGVINSTNADDVIDPSQTVKVSWPAGSPDDPNSRIYPFKVHLGNQPYDKIHRTLLVPMLSGDDGYWQTLDWQRALSKGQENVGLPYSGKFDFIDTTYVFPITHMVAPKAKSLTCNECHSPTESRLAGVPGVYMPARDKIKWLNLLGWLVCAGSLGGVTLHALGRVVSRKRNGKKEPDMLED